MSTYFHTMISFCQGASVWQMDGRTDVDNKVRSNEVRCAQKLHFTGSCGLYKHGSVHLTVMASSHHRHRLRLSCLVGGVNWVRDSRRHFSIYWRLNSFVQSYLRWERIWDLVSKYDVTICNHVACELETVSGQDKTHFTPHFVTRQNCFEIFSCRQSWFVANSVHTANTDKTRLAIVSSLLLVG